MRILTEQQENLLKEERELLNDLRITLTRFEVDPQDQKTLGESIQQLDELFLLVVVGEFNAGKSAFINALLGQSLLEEGVTPTTTRINILRYGESREREVVNEHQHVLKLPAEMLTEISIVDTPGTNTIIRSHEAITSQFVPRSDIVLFLTSADRPFTESERVFLERIRDWGKKVAIIINKIDIVEGEKDLEQIESFVSDNARQLLGIMPEIFPVSARDALRAKQDEPELWHTSRFEFIEGYIHDTLDESSRLRLKFLNPMGIAMNLMDKYLQVIVSRLDLLKEDFDMLNDVEAQLKMYKEDMERDFVLRMSDIENILFEMEQRGQDYLDDTFRLARVFDLASKDRIQREFEHRVIGDVHQRIEQKIKELIGWLADSNLHQWQAVNERLAERRQYHDPIAGETGADSSHYDRERLIEEVGTEVLSVVETYDKTRESQKVAGGAQITVAVTVALELGAVGLGTLVTLLATTVAADATGILMAGLIAALGFLIIPAARRRASSEMKAKIADLRSRLVESLRKHFEREIEGSLQDIRTAIAPYTHFVHSERDKLVAIQDELEQIRAGLRHLKLKVEEI